MPGQLVWWCIGYVVSFDMIFGDTYSLGGATLLEMGILVICSAVMMFGHEVKHFVLDPHVLA